MRLTLLLVALCVCQVLGGDVEECSSGECNEGSYCEGSECCTTPSCNQCVDTCRSGCAQSGCASGCVNRCLPCSSRCATRSCRRRCTSNQPTTTLTESKPSSSDVKVDTNPKVDVHTSLDFTNHINNTNHINTPVNVSSNNINNVHVSTESKPGKDVEIISTKEETKEDKNCCLVIPPKQCKYEDKDLKCAQEPYKLCSDTCKSPIIVPHPVPRPYPVPQPYPVEQRVPVYIPVTKVVPQKVIVPQPYPMQVPVPHPVPVLVRQEPQIVTQKLVVPQPYPVIRHIVKQVTQPVYIRERVPYPVQQPCPVVLHKGGYIPTCSTVQEASQYIGTSQQFLLDTATTSSNLVVPQCSVLNKPPWFVCEKQQIQDCGQCTFCGGQYNPQMCINSSKCSASCQQILRSVNFPSTIEKQLKCTSFSDGRIKCQ